MAKRAGSMKPMRANLSKLVAQASRQVATVNVGRDETAIALASSVSGLRLDDMSKFKWDQPLNSTRFGLKSPEDINRFKQNLTRLMPDAADWIQSAPISPNNTAAGVADLVAAAKRD